MRTYLNQQLTIFIFQKPIKHWILSLVAELTYKNIYNQQPIKFEMDVDISCPSCAKEYQDHNPPRLLPCGHTYCQICISALIQQTTAQSIICPEDHQPINVPPNIDHFPKNIALLRLIQCNKKNSSNNSSASMKEAFFDVSKINKEEYCQQDQDAVQLISAIQRGSLCKDSESLADDLPAITVANPQIQLPEKQNTVKKSQKKEEGELCLLHQRPIEVICMKDFQRLCSKCALFGQHKGHQFKSIEEIDRQNHKSYLQIVSVFEQKQKFMQHITNKTIQKEILGVLAIKKANLKKEIAERFKKWAEQLAKKERSLYKRLDEANSIVTQRIQSSLQMDKELFSYYESWQQKTLQIIKENQKVTQQGQVKFYLKGAQIFKEGKEIISKLQKTQDSAQFQTLKVIQEFTIKFNQSDYYQAVNNLVHVFQYGKEEQEKKNDVNRRSKQNEATLANRQKCDISKKNHTERHQSDQSLLQFGQVETQSFAESISNSQILNESFISTKDEIITKTKEQPIRSIAKKNKTAFTAKQKTMTSKEIAIPSAMSRQDIKKKLKTFKVPEKYDKVLEGIVNDSLETVDLTNAELGDTQILKILDLMKYNTKVRALKLIRNKLTDEGVASMLPFFSNLTTLNLSQNQLTETTLSMLADSKPNMPLLKNIVLSQTKIVERKSKPIIQRLKKLQVCVSV